MRVISEEEELIASCVTAEDIDKVSDGADYWRCRGSGCTAAQRPACELFACAACGVVRPAARLALDQRMARTVATCVRDAEVGATTCVQSVLHDGEAAPAIDVSLPFEGAWPRACSKPATRMVEGCCSRFGQDLPQWQVLANNIRCPNDVDEHKAADARRVLT